MCALPLSLKLNRQLQTLLDPRKEPDRQCCQLRERESQEVLIRLVRMSRMR
jgi:hypothetical protein